MPCRCCFCFSPRTGARLVGILDMILGFVGILFSGLVLAEIRYAGMSNQTPTPSTDNETLAQASTSVTITDSPGFDHHQALKVMALGLIFPAVLTCVIGITILIAVSKNHLCIGRLAYVLNIFLVVGGFATFFILFGIGYHWIDASPVLMWAAIQIVFLCAIQEFIKLELSLESV